MNKTEQKILKEIEAKGSITIEMTSFKGKTYNKQMMKSANKLVEKGILAREHSERNSSMIQESKLFGRIGGSYMSTSVAVTFKKA